MNKIWVIITREYLVRVKKKSFIITTFLMPLLMVAMIMLPVYLANKAEKECTVYVLDENDYFIHRFHNTSKIKFEYPSGELETLKKRCVNGECDAVLHILAGNQSNHANLFFYSDPPLSLKGGISDQMDEIMFDHSLQKEFQIDIEKYKMLKTTSHSDIQTVQIDEEGQGTNRMMELNRVVGMLCGLIIYMFVFMYANIVMRSTIEEKSNRIMEVIVSSVKPFQFMMGKIVGVALAGITQFVLQVAFVLILLVGVGMALPAMVPEMASATGDVASAEVVGTAQSDIFSNISAFYSFPFSTIVICFFLYFLLGYLIYASLFAGIGSTVDNETDSNQFVLPVSLPLILSLMVIVTGISPQSTLVRWLSLIPFTSPIAMLYRLPSRVPAWELGLSLLLLAATFVLCVWLSAKIYRVGLLNYGKKVTWKDLGKWITGKW
ncbi:MAG: ABC transporter permease [Bacteroidales bacterium]|nr:ABC transporter permease [Bacteroidales bacterium]